MAGQFARGSRGSLSAATASSPEAVSHETTVIGPKGVLSDLRFTLQPLPKRGHWSLHDATSDLLSDIAVGKATVTQEIFKQGHLQPVSKTFTKLLV